MKPIDYRNATFDSIKTQLNEQRLMVWQALSKHGPCTTRQLAERSGIDILSVRPRITDLHQLGYVKLMSGRCKEGVYQACTEAEAHTHFVSLQREATRETQIILAI